jgi:anti-sigma factor RsiW
VLLVLGVALGTGLGWGLRPWVEGGGLAQVRHPAGALPVAALAAAPAYVRDAAAAHALYTPERRHPVEVGAEQQQHLVQWLSRRLGAELHLPVLTEQGYQLVGGRLLPAGELALDAAPGAALAPQAVARAQFMYESAAGVRLTLYVAVAPGAHTPPAFRLGQVDAGAQRSLYWADGPFGYALTGALPADALTALAMSVHRQIGR